MPNWTRALLFSISCAMLAPAIAGAAGNEDVPVTNPPVMLHPFGAYCGLRAVYAAMKYEGGGVKFPSLLESRYLGSSQGSSLAELRQAAADSGFQAVPVRNVSDVLLGDHDIR